MLYERSCTFTIVGMEELEISPSVVLYSLNREPGVVTPALVRVLVLAVGSCHHHQLRQRFGQHAPVLLTGFELLFGSFLVLDVGAGAKPVQGHALCISLRHASSKKPAIRSACAVLQAMFHFIGHACLDGGLPHIPYTLLVIRMHTRHPALTFDLFEGHRQTADQALMTVGEIPIASGVPDQLGEAITRGTQV